MILIIWFSLLFLQVCNYSFINYFQAHQGIRHSYLQDYLTKFKTYSNSVVGLKIILTKIA